MPSRPYVIGVDGPSGAGKTRLAEQLADTLDGAGVVHLDDLYPGWDGLEAALAKGRPADILEWMERGRLASALVWLWCTC